MSALDELERLERLAKSPPPSGTYCRACRETGLAHCSDPVNCGGQRPIAECLAEARAALETTNG